MVEKPTILCADTDGNGPAKRRRRPALSCVECRVRKVKCDREKPCGACTRIKSVACTYRPIRPGIRSQSTEATSAGCSLDEDHGESARSSPQPLVPSDFDVIINRYVAPGLLGEHGNGKLKPLPADRPCFNLSSHSDSGQASVISSLLDRISNLEGRLAAATLDDQPGSSTQPTSEVSSVTSGQFVKSKFYGQSHWINAIEPYDALGDANTTINHNTNRKEVYVCPYANSTQNIY
jgi:hypothetical protein